MELTLGQLGERIDEGVWLSIKKNGGMYVTWREDQDPEYREIFGFEPDEPLPRIQVRRWLNPAQAQHQRKARARYRGIGEMPAELEEKLQREAIAHTVLVGWERIGTQEGETLPYTPEVGIEALRADPIFMDAVIAAAFEEQNFRERAIQEDADALGKPSDGSSSGDPS